MNNHVVPIMARSGRVILFAGVGMFSGCMLRPDYVRPDATIIPPAYVAASGEWKTATPGARLPRGNLWVMFGDPEPDQLETDAGSANQSLKAAAARFNAARAEADVAFSGLFPQIVAGAGATRQHDSQNRPLNKTGQAAGKSFTYDNFTLPFVFEYELDLWGRVRRR